VLLDEPSEGMAPLVVQQMAHMIRTLRDQGVSLLLAEQNLEFLRSVSDRVYPMAQGTITAVGVAE
jgi:branched-chain amino acid transport system ATP-binding protein